MTNTTTKNNKIDFTKINRRVLVDIRNLRTARPSIINPGVKYAVR